VVCSVMAQDRRMNGRCLSGFRFQTHLPSSSSVHGSSPRGGCSYLCSLCWKPYCDFCGSYNWRADAADGPSDFGDHLFLLDLQICTSSNTI
jgi:hypothetical protein